MPQIVGLSQLSPEWITHRIGMVTASRMADVCAKLKRKDGEAAKRYDYKMEKVLECITNRAAEHYVTPAMEFGIENQGLAEAAYEIERDINLVPGGFWVHDEISKWGASPDGLLGYDGLVEFKVPTPGTHLETLISKQIPPEYELQMLAQMACTGRQWCDFVSFQPYFPHGNKLFIKRFMRDEGRIAVMQDEVCTFLLEVIELIKQLEPEECTQEQLSTS